MKKFRLSKLALADLDEAWDYTEERWNIERADALMDELHETFILLLEFPELGRERDELIPGLRSLPVSSFVVFYQISDKSVDVARVVHGARDIGRLFRDQP